MNDEYRPSTLESPSYFDVLLALSRYDHRTHKGIVKFAAQNNWHLNCDLILSGTMPSYWNGDGIIALLTDEDPVMVNYVLEKNVPFVDLSIMRMDIQAPRVSADHAAIGITAADYFLSKGFRQFAFFSVTDDKVSQARRAGFLGKISSPSHRYYDWVISNNDDGEGLSIHDRIYRRLQGVNLPLAVFCNRDHDACLVLGACLQHGYGVPEQIAILGVDNNELITNSLKVPISSVNHDVEALGYEGAKLLHSVMKGDVQELKSLEPRLIKPNGISSRRSTDILAISNPLVRVALNHIKNHIAYSNYSVEKTAESCGVTRRHLDNLFHVELGCTMHAYLNESRLRLAQNALLNSKDPIAKISEYSGFTRVQYFNNFFRKSTGKTPSEFRKSNSN